MAADKQLYNMVLEDFWMDIGQPKDYIKGMGLYLDYIRPHCDGINDSVFASGEGIEGHVLIVSKWVDWDDKYDWYNTLVIIIIFLLLTTLFMN